MVLLAGTVAVLGRWISGKPVNARIITGTVVAALIVSIIGEADEGLGKGFAGIVLVSSLLVYGAPILEKTGVIG
jgi:uncharacterized membrane protein YjjB (DUF3815 family)